MRPVFIDIEPALGCNLRCRMCHVSYMDAEPRFLDINRVKSWDFIRGRTVSLGSLFEPTIHPHFNDLIGMLNDYNCEINMVTNAKLLNKKRFPNLLESKLGCIFFSFDGATQESYEYIRRNGKFHQTIDNIKGFIKNVNEADLISKNTMFVVNFTANKSNMHEILHAVDLWHDCGINTLNVIAMVDRFNEEFFKKNSIYNKIPELSKILEKAALDIIEKEKAISIKSAYFSDVNSDLHLGTNWYKFKVGENTISFDRNTKFFGKPLHHSFNFGDYGIKHVSCGAPFRTIRIDYDGNLYICQSKHIGNIYDNSVDEIWSSAERKQILDNIHSNPEICTNCHYFKLCINSQTVRYDDESNFISQNLIEDLSS